jgi:hypothetical protein
MQTGKLMVWFLDKAAFELILNLSKEILNFTSQSLFG